MAKKMKAVAVRNDYQYTALLQAGLREEPGWQGFFTRQRYKRALPNGTRIRKRNSEPGDSHQDGEEGTVLGSVGHRNMDPVFIYFVEWDSEPRFAVAVVDERVEPCPSTSS